MRYPTLALVLLLALFLALTGCAAGSQPGTNCAYFANAINPSEPVCFEISDGWAIIEGDIMLGRVAELKQAGETLRSGVAGSSTQGVRRWPNGRVPYVILPEASSKAQYILDAIAHWEEHTSIRFIPRNGEVQHIAFGGQQGCSSPLGMSPNGNLIHSGNCGPKTLIHEIGHSLGLHHEHMRADRDKYITLHWENISAFAGVGPSAYRNLFWHGQDIGPYDFDSIMHYSTVGPLNAPTMTKKDGSRIVGNTTHLSAKDIATIESLYSDDFVDAPAWMNGVSDLPLQLLSDTSVRGRLFVRSTTASSIQLEHATSPNGPWTVGAQATLPLPAPNSFWEPVVENLEPDTKYYFRARNLRGTATSDYSALQSVTTLFPMLPVAPTSLHTTFVAKRAVTLRWTDRSDNEVRFQVESRRNDQTAISSWSLELTDENATSFTFPGLIEGVRYEFRVRAQNSAGLSDYSNVVSATPHLGNTIGGSISGLSSGEQVQLSHGDGAHYPFSGSSYVLKTIFEEGVTYSITAVPPTGKTCTVQNGTGIMPATALTNVNVVCKAVTLPQPAPGTPNLSLLSTRAVGVTWTAQANASTRAFVIQTSSNLQQWTVRGSVGPTGRSFLIAPQPLGSTLYVRVGAQSAANGQITYSSPKAITVGIPPAPKITGYSRYRDRIYLNFSASSNHDGVVEVQMSSNGATFKARATLSVSTRSYMVTGLTPNTLYYFRVKATNALGISYSNVVSIRTLP